MAGTDNSTDVTLATVANNYLSLSGQAITAGTVPLSLGGTGATSASAARTALGVDAAGTDNSTDVTLASVTGNYLSIDGQAITAGTVPVSLGGSGQTTYTNGQLLIGNSTGNTLSKATLTEGSNITITNGNGSITIASQDTTYSAGTNISLSGTTFNVDDAFLKNNANDSTSGVLTAGGFTTTGTWTFDSSSGSGTVGITTVQPSTASFGDNNITLMTSAAIQDKIDTYAGTGLTLNGNQFDIDSSVVTLTGSQTLTNKDLSGATLTGSLTAGGGTGTSGQVLKSTGSGVQWADESGGGGSGDITGVDLTEGTGISITNETNTTSGNYSATINCDIEGTEVKSTGVSTGCKYLMEDGDGTSSWQEPTGLHVVSDHYPQTFLVYNYWQSILGSSYANLLVKLDPSKSSSPRKPMCLCELYTPRTRPYGKLFSFHIKDYQNNVYWDGLGSYIGSNSNPSNGFCSYDDTNHQMTMVWKCLIDLSDYGSNWATTTFNLGVRIKANASNGYIYGNTTGQYVFKVTELASVSSNDGTIGGRQV